MLASGQAILSLFERLSLPQSEDEAARLLRAALEARGARVVSFMNAHALNMAVGNRDFRAALLGSDLLLRDGIGAKIGCHLLGRPPGLNLNGTDLIPKIIDQFRTQRIALLGAERRWLEAAADRLRGQGLSDLILCDGFHAPSHYVQLVLETRPALVVLAMGMPKQELVAAEIKTATQAAGQSCLIVNGGAIVDFTAGKLRRAPVWIRRLGLEWLFRLALEPGRLAKRYILGNPLFLWRVGLARLTSGTVARSRRRLQT